MRTLLFVLLSSATHLVSSLSVPEGWPWSKKPKNKKPEAEPAEAQQAPAASDEDTVKDPSHPGCYMRMPSGCPKHPMKTQLWRHDTWAEEQDLDKATCESRKGVWDSYCDSQDAKMVFVGKQPSEPRAPLSALQISSVVVGEEAAEWHWPWSRKKKETAGGQLGVQEIEVSQVEEKKAETPQAQQTQQAQQAQPAPLKINEDDIKDPSQPGCYMRMPSGCPAKPMDTLRWRHDAWAEQMHLDSNSCKMRRTVWNGYCDSQDAKMIHVSLPVMEEAKEVGGAKPQSELAPFDVVFDVALNGNIPETANFTVRVHPEWAPRGAAQFKRLVEQGWYNDAGVFRVVPGFVAQFGLPAKAQPELPKIEDDPVIQSNKRGKLVFATSGPNTRTSQLFINYGDNSDNLDGQGFAPFAEVVGNGMAVVDRFFEEYGEEPNQKEITAQGNSYLDARFPKLTKFTKVTIQA